MGRIIKTVAFTAVCYGIAKAEYIMGYIVGTLDTLGAVNVDSYERDIAGVTFRLKKDKKKEKEA